MTELTGLSHHIWDMKYRLKDEAGTPVDQTIDDTWRRVAKALAAPEKPSAQLFWEDGFYRALQNFKFLPAGRILAGAGTERDVTLFNCFVMGTIADDMGGIFESLKEAALTMQQGGGIGYDFSTLRPKGALVRGVGADASGPISFMDVWDAMCRTIMSAGSRRGAMMATLRCDHPDIEAFIAVKEDAARLRMFNLSVLVTDAFIQAVKTDAPWPLIFDGKTYRTVSARDLWNKIMMATYNYAEPGVIFIDRINQKNNLNYCETIAATNPCGEQPLPPYGACLLGSINLARLIKDPFGSGAHLDESALESLIPTAIRMMDNAIDASNFPLDAQAQEAKNKRRIGLGVTGLADALIMCGVRYGSPDSLTLIDRWMRLLRDSAYRASAELATEKGPFPLYDAQAYSKTDMVQSLDPDVQALIVKNGVRNALLTSIAPTGTISLLADNTSSGIEPVFDLSYKRRVLEPDGSAREEDVQDFALKQYLNAANRPTDLPQSFVTTQALDPKDHVAVQATVQKYVDSSISKTINMPEDISFEAFQSVYMDAWDQGLKGCTTYRPNAVTGSVLTSAASVPLATHDTVPDADAEVVYMTEPLDRPPALEGHTYKVRWPDSDHAIYITLNDIESDGRRRPFEIFINSKNMEHYAWTLALTRMISAVFRRGGDVSFVVEELKAVFDPRGGQWMDGEYVPSLLAAIGAVIEQHMVRIGFMNSGEVDPAPPPAKRQAAILAPNDHETSQSRRRCPKCSNPTLVRQEGCDTCVQCGYSKCS